MSKHYTNIAFAFLVLIYMSFAFYSISFLSLSYSEVSFLEKDNLIAKGMKLIMPFFDDKDMAIRIPILLLSIINITLLFVIAKEYLVKKVDALYVVLFFMCMSGVYISSIIINEASINIFLLFLFIYLYKKINKFILYMMLALLCAFDNSFIVLFISLMLHSIQDKNKQLFILSLVLVITSFVLFWIEPYSINSHFLETLSSYPLLLGIPIFFYIFYVFYYTFYDGEKDLIWYLGIVGFVSSLILSFTGAINLDDFAPYLFIAILKSVKHFYHYYRVKLRTHRVKIKIFFNIMILVSLLQFLIFVFNYDLYRYLDESNHFATKNHFMKELSINLKNDGIYEIKTNKKTKKILSYYGIKDGNKYILTANKNGFYKKYHMKISNTIIKTFYVKKGF